jgi:general secretion pathway protein E
MQTAATTNTKPDKEPSVLPPMSAEGTFTLDQIRFARKEAMASGQKLLGVLEEASGLAPKDFTIALARTFSMEPLVSDAMHDLEPAFDLMPYGESLRHECLVFRDPNGKVLLAFTDPFSQDFRGWAERRIEVDFEWRLAHGTDIQAFLARHEEGVRAMEGVAEELRSDTGGESDVESLSLKAISEHASPVVKLVHSTLYDALKAEASDIHLETTANGLAVKYRIDGVLVQAGSASGIEFSEQVVSRVKIMADLDITERRVPQDGRFKVAANGREIDFRVSIMPSIFGEDAVLRVLDKQALADQAKGLSLEQLGFDERTISTLRRMAKEPYGMVLVTGPTGSGKTTSLYAAISEINHGRDKIITIEDPVEYQLPGVLQIPVNEKKGLTFARGLRSILRHDPDKIMVGEIRDGETAQIAVQAALTGHLVFTTVHANSVFDVIGRFMHMGVDPYSFVSALNGIAAQRLVRLVCADCAVEYEPDGALLEESGLSAEQVKGFAFRQGRGCGQCRGSGYKGRRAIAEVLYLNEDIREAIIAKEPVRRIREIARANGTRFLREAAVDLVRQGLTTLEEINRVTFVA